MCTLIGGRVGETVIASRFVVAPFTHDKHPLLLLFAVCFLCWFVICCFVIKDEQKTSPVRISLFSEISVGGRNIIGFISQLEMVPYMLAA